MSLSTIDAVNETFHRAVQEHLQKALRTGEDWDRFNAIKEETTQRLDAEERAYAGEFSERMAEAKQIILREEHGIRLDQPLPPGAEKLSDADALERKAGTRVLDDHRRRVAVIHKDECDRFRDLTAEIRARDAPTQTQTQLQDRSHDRSGPTRQ